MTAHLSGRLRGYGALRRGLALTAPKLETQWAKELESVKQQTPTRSGTDQDPSSESECYSSKQ